MCAGLIVLVAAACGPGGNRSDDPTAAAGEADALQDGYLGPVSYRYDPLVLAAANVRLAVPPDEEASVNAVKLVPVRGLAEDAALCPADEGACPLEEQPGLSMALLERPFASYEASLREGEVEGSIRPLALAGAEGIVVDLGQQEGLDVTYQLVPVAERALLIKLQRDSESPAEDEAIDQVIDSLDLGG